MYDGVVLAAIAAVVAVAAITSPDGVATVATVAIALGVGFAHTQTLVLMRGIGGHGHNNTPLTTLSGWLMGLGWFITTIPLKIALGVIVSVQLLNAFGRYQEANSLRSEKERREKENLLRRRSCPGRTGKTRAQNAVKGGASARRGGAKKRRVSPGPQPSRLV